MECTTKFRGSVGCKGLVIFVKHDNACIIRERDLFLYGYITFDTDNIVGKYVLDDLKRGFAKQWNRRG